MLAEKHGLGDKVTGIVRKHAIPHHSLRSCRGASGVPRAHQLYRYCYEEGLNVSLRETVARARARLDITRNGVA